MVYWRPAVDIGQPPVVCSSSPQSAVYANVRDERALDALDGKEVRMTQETKSVITDEMRAAIGKESPPATLEV